VLIFKKSLSGDGLNTRNRLRRSGRGRRSRRLWWSTNSNWGSNGLHGLRFLGGHTQTSITRSKRNLKATLSIGIRLGRHASSFLFSETALLGFEAFSQRTLLFPVAISLAGDCKTSCMTAAVFLGIQNGTQITLLRRFDYSVTTSVSNSILVGRRALKAGKFGVN